MYIKKILINTLLTTHICYYPCVHKYKQRLLQVLFVLLNLWYDENNKLYLLWKESLNNDGQ